MVENEENTPLPRWLKITGVTDQTCLSRSTVNREIKAGRLKAVKVGRALRISEAELQKYMASLESEGEL